DRSSSEETSTTVDKASEGTDTDNNTGGLTDNSRVFFANATDFNTVSAAMERFFPETESGPGAIELGCAFYLDGQLTGQYGFNSKEYMHGPFAEPMTSQGYQSKLKCQ